MVSNNSRLISKVSSDKMHAILSDIPPESSEALNSFCNDTLNKNLYFKKNSSFPSLLAEIEKKFNAITSNLSKEGKKKLRYAMVANLALNLPNSIHKRDLPESILQLYPSAVERLSIFLERMEFDDYDISSEFYRKDISLTLGHTVPCGALALELFYYFKVLTVLRSILRGGNFNATYQYIKSFGSGPWFLVHLDTRYLDEFNEEGYDRCYLFIAEMLKKRPSIRGFIGTTWLYDPNLPGISPHLSFLLKRPLEHGAFLMKHGSSPIDIERATSKSKKRRRLYEEGKYLPVSYSLFWPRKSLLSWAHSNKI